MRVARLGFSPVKGTRHLGREAMSLDAAGPVGDRAYCMIDGTAPRVLRTVQHGSLVAVDARTEGTRPAGGQPGPERLCVTLPDGATAAGVPQPTGETLTCDYWGRPASLELLDGPHAGLFSTYLGKPVRLARAPRRAVVYGAGLTLVTTASLAALADRLGPLDPARFRATIVLDTDDPYAEEGWHGRVLRLGQARVRIGTPIPRCAVVDLSPETGERDLALFRHLCAERPRASTGEPWFGVYAEVVEPGTVRVGDDAVLNSP